MSWSVSTFFGMCISHLAEEQHELFHNVLRCSHMEGNGFWIAGVIAHNNQDAFMATGGLWEWLYKGPPMGLQCWALGFGYQGWLVWRCPVAFGALLTDILDLCYCPRPMEAILDLHHHVMGPQMSSKWVGLSHVHYGVYGYGMEIFDLGTTSRS